jgi:mRNA guanylyltransferase
MSRFHTHTLLDGEIVLDTFPDGTEQPKFLVFDALAVDNKNLLERPLDRRLGHFMQFILEPYKASLKEAPHLFAAVPFIVEDKSMQKGYGIDMMFRDILPNLAHGNDGLIFTSVKREYICGTDQYILKWKPDDENSIDFRLNLEFPPSIHLDPCQITNQTPLAKVPPGTIFRLSIWKGDAGYEPWGDMHIPAGDWETIRQAPEGVLPLENAIIECRWDKKAGVSGRWRFMRFRTDKQDANYITVARNVQESIMDGVTRDELVSWAVDIKAGWRSRNPK